MIHFRLLTQHPKPKDVGAGTLDINSDGDASFFVDSHVVNRMARVRIEWAGADGILLAGLEPDGVDRAGRSKYLHQEWMLKYIQI